jgi:hypothetical protein
MMKSDLELAREIAEAHRLFGGALGSMEENVAQAVAAGIVLGRKDGLRMASEMVDAALRASAEAIVSQLQKDSSN